LLVAGVEIDLDRRLTLSSGLLEQCRTSLEIRARLPQIGIRCKRFLDQFVERRRVIKTPPGVGNRVLRECGTGRTVEGTLGRGCKSTILKHLIRRVNACRGYPILTGVAFPPIIIGQGGAAS